MAIWGMDLGGTKIEGAVLEIADSPEVLIRQRIATEAEQGYEHVLGQIKKLVQILESEVGHYPERIGIGTPGSTDPQTGLLKNCNSQHLNGKPFKDDVEKLLGIPVALANDANCFALAETRMGVVQDIAPDAEVVFGVIMGTGVGGGLVVNGKVINGRQGIGGEWGHSFLDASGGECYCGDTGCVERILAGPALERFYQDISGVEVSLKEIYHRFTSGRSDDFAVKTMQRLTFFFGLGIANLVNIVDPDVIVIGGGVGNIDLLYSDGIPEVRKHVFNPTFDTPIVKPKLGDSAGVFGAAFLVA